jgi:hypothetical protein
MSEAEMGGSGLRSTSLERGRDEVLRLARPLPPDEDTLIGDLSEDEDRIFLEAIIGA